MAQMAPNGTASLSTDAGEARCVLTRGKLRMPRAKDIANRVAGVLLDLDNREGQIIRI